MSRLIVGPLLRSTCHPRTLPASCAGPRAGPGTTSSREPTAVQGRTFGSGRCGNRGSVNSALIYLVNGTELPPAADSPYFLPHNTMSDAAVTNYLVKHPRLLKCPIVRADGMVVPLSPDYPFLDSQLFALTTEALTRRIARRPADVICGALTGGAIMAAPCALRLNKRFIYVRSEAKKYSIKRAVYGTVRRGDRVILVDDFIVVGEMKEIFLKHLRAIGVTVTDIIVYCDMGLEKKAWLKRQRIRLESLIETPQLINRWIAVKKLSPCYGPVYQQFQADPYGWHKDKRTWRLFKRALRESSATAHQ